MTSLDDPNARPRARWPVTDSLPFVRLSFDGRFVEVWKRSAAFDGPLVVRDDDERLLCRIPPLRLPSNGMIPLEGDERPQIVCNAFVVIWADQQTVVRVYQI